MIIDRLVLKNFKRFRNEEIHFRDGITGILGNNGTGKSSIVQAIFFALYGVQATGISADYIVSSFASPKEKCEVRLDFRIGGNNYTVVRTFKKGKTIQHDATFHREGKLMATGVSQVETEVKRTLGMGPVDFRNTIYAAQKDLLTLLENTPGKRKEWFLRALGIDFLNTESQRILKERADAKTGELQSLEGELRAMRGRQSGEHLSALQASVAGFGTTLKALNKRQEESAKKKRAIDEEIRQLDLQKMEHTRLLERQASCLKESRGLTNERDVAQSKLAEIARLEPEYRTLQERVAALPEKRLFLETLRKRKGESDQFQTAIRFAGQKTADLCQREEKVKAKMAGLEQDTARKSSLITEIKTKLFPGQDITEATLDSALASLEENIQHAAGTLSSREKQLAKERKKLLADFETIKTAGADGTCPLCRQKLGTHFMEIGFEFEARVREIDSEAAKVHGEQGNVAVEKSRIASIKPAHSEIRNLDSKLKLRESIEAELADLKSQINAQIHEQQILTGKLQELGFDEPAFSQAGKEVTELEKTERRYNDLRAKLAGGEYLRKQIKDLEARGTEKKTELDDLASSLACSPYDEKKGTAAEQARTKIDADLNSINAEIAVTSERLAHVEEKIAEYKRAEAEIDGLQKQVEDLREEIELIKLTRSIIADYVIYLMQVVRSRIEGEVSRIISEITSGRYEQVLLDEDFNLLVRDIDNDYSIERFSGGEQDDIAVALRIALSRYLAELHNVHESTILIFDEIFGSQDEERRNNLLTTLRTQESRFPQIVLISHIQEMQGEFANTLMVEMGTDRSSRVKEVD